MTRIAIDIVKIVRILGVGVTPTPVNGIIVHATGSITLAAVLNDPNSQSPYTYLWEQLTPSAATFGSPSAASTTFGTLLASTTYALKLTVTTSRLIVVSFPFTIAVP